MKGSTIDGPTLFLYNLCSRSQTSHWISKLDVDVFQPTARITEKQEHAIEGLLTLEEVANLVNNGYRVLVEEDASKRSRATEIITSAEDWIKEFERK